MKAHYRHRRVYPLIDGVRVSFQPNEYAVFMMLWNARRRALSVLQIWDALYAHREDGGPSVWQIGRYLWRIRRALEPTRFRIPFFAGHRPDRQVLRLVRIPIVGRPPDPRGRVTIPMATGNVTALDRQIVT